MLNPLTFPRSSRKFHAMTHAPPITRENARELGARGNKVRWDRYRQQKQDAILARLPALQPIATPADLAAVARTKSQVARLDEQLDAAIDAKDFALAKELSTIKAKLWPLAQPTAGSLRPGRSRRPEAPTLPEPTPVSAPVPQNPPTPTA